MTGKIIIASIGSEINSVYLAHQAVKHGWKVNLETPPTIDEITEELKSKLASEITFDSKYK